VSLGCPDSKALTEKLDRSVDRPRKRRDEISSGFDEVKQSVETDLMKMKRVLSESPRMSSFVFFPALCRSSPGAESCPYAPSSVFSTPAGDEVGEDECRTGLLEDHR